MGTRRAWSVKPFDRRRLALSAGVIGYPMSSHRGEAELALAGQLDSGARLHYSTTGVVK